MWFLVVLAASALAYLGYEIGHTAAPPSSSRSRDITSGAPALVEAPSAVKTLADCIENGMEFPLELVEAAKAECYRTGDGETLAALAARFPDAPPPPPAQDPPPAPLPAPTFASPIYGVSDDEWSAFIASLATQPATFRDSNHVGMFHHNAKRLAELGIDPATLTDDASQYAALKRDLEDMLSRDAKLINHFAGDVITINGQQTPITRSGILALIKSAGPSKAREWLSNDVERVRGPNTTMVFLRCNGIF